MKVLFKKLSENAKTPVKARENDFCYDIWATDVEEIAPNVYKYHTGLAMEIELDEEEITTYDKKNCTNGISVNFKNSNIILDIDIRPRSSIWKTGLVLSNSEGTVDFGYRNEICFIFYHVMPNMPKYEVGDRIGQMKLGFTLPIEFVEVNELNMNTERGLGGFGSSGKN